MIICRDHRDDTGKITKKYYRVENVNPDKVRLIEWRGVDGNMTKTFYVARASTKECLIFFAWILFGFVMGLYAMFALRYSQDKGWWQDKTRVAGNRTGFF